MRKFGLIGYPLSHSFSKKYFTEKFEREHIDDCAYELYPIATTEEFPALLAADPELRGINVTIPHKLSVMEHLDALDTAAEAIGAVNCVDIRPGAGKPALKGYNTDAYGFEVSLKPHLKDHHHQALVFGDGGAAKAVKYVLRELNIPFLTVVRNPVAGAVLYKDIDAGVLKSHTLLINTTPLGMSPVYDSCPDIPYEALGPLHLAYDLVYNPELTTFLSKARAQGAAVKNGLEMLHLQAERSWYIWNS